MCYNHSEHYEPSEPTSYWCDKCDTRIVDSYDNTTGLFYVQYGHSYNKETCKFDGEYIGVMYALCHECITGL